MNKQAITFKLNSDKTCGYVYLPAHLGVGVFGAVKKQISLHSVIENYIGPDVFLDFDVNGVLVGIEILLDDSRLIE